MDADALPAFLDLTTPSPTPLAPGGLAFCALFRTNGCYFLMTYAGVAYHFSLKMSRLMIICAPIISVLGGIGVGWGLDLCLGQFYRLLRYPPIPVSDPPADAAGETNGNTEKPKTETTESKSPSNPKGGKNGKDASRAAEPADAKKKNEPPATVKSDDPWPLCEYEEEYRPGGVSALKRWFKSLCFKAVPAFAVRHARKHEVYQAKIPGLRLLRAAGAAYAVYSSFIGFSSESYMGVAIGRCCALLPVHACPNSFKGAKFYSKDTLKHAEAFAEQLSQPQIMWQAQLRSGEKIIVDDYYRGYQWVDANTPKDSRVMAWWDYGYQITGIANRTSIADGNTWNHEHIATLGYMLTSPEKRAHKYIRHMADYVLVWAGGRGDDMGKSPHLARIANSVFPDHCGDADPRCHNFGFYQGGEPTPMMEKSLLYKLVKNGEGRASVDTSLFQEVHTTRHGFMRIYKVLNVSQKSKRWCADPANRKCDAPGSWYSYGGESIN